MLKSLRPLFAHARRQTPPGPRPRGLLGALPEVATGHLFELLTHMWRSYGDLTSVRIGRRLLISVVDPVHIQHVLVGGREIYTKASHRAAVLLGDGLPASNGESWSRQRRLLQPRFAPRELGYFDSNIEAATVRVMERWARVADRGDVIDLDQEMTALTLDLSLRALSDDYLSDTHEGLRQAIVEAVDFVAASGQIFRLPLSLPTRRNRRFRAALAEIHGFIDSSIARHHESPGKGDLLAFLIDSQAQGATWMSDSLIRDEAVSLLLGAYDSTARALTWTWALLEQHRDARERLYAEVDKLGGRIPLSADRKALPWTQALIHESLRLYPPFWVFPRHVAADDELGGYRMPAGATVMISPYLVQRHPGLWRDPERFDPERFLSNGSSSRVRASAMYFGFGPRTCVGNHLALLEVSAAIAGLSQHFELVRLGAPPTPEFATTLRPRGAIKMKVCRRTT